MASDGPDPPECDAEVYRRGEVVFVTHTIPPNALEGWVRKVAALSEQRVDWHYVGGRAVIKALGDLARVRAAMTALKAEHDQLYWLKVKGSLGGLEMPDARYIPWFEEQSREDRAGSCAT